MRPLKESAIVREWTPRVGSEATHALVWRARLLWLECAVLAICGIVATNGIVTGPLGHTPSAWRVVGGIAFACFVGIGLTWSIYGRGHYTKKALKLAADYVRQSHPRLIRFHEVSLSDPARFDEFMDTVVRGASPDRTVSGQPQDKRRD